MGTYVNKAMPGFDIERLFTDCVIILDEPHKAGDVIDDRIILTENIGLSKEIPTEEELDNIVYEKGYAVKAVKIDFIDDITTKTDMTLYGFIKVDENRYCKTNEAIGWARMECNISKLPKHEPTDKDMKFWLE